MPNIRVSDEIYAEIKAFADSEMRSVANATEYLLRKGVAAGQEPVSKTVSGGSNPSTPATGLVKGRTVGDVLADIRQQEAERDEAVRYCQDAEYAKKIAEPFDEVITQLWTEYHLIKN